MGMLFGFILLHSSFCLRALGQSYSIDWYKIAGGGGTSTNGQYSVSGTIGQGDAGGAMTGGNYSVTGGFWSLISAVQTAGLPNLTVTHSGTTVIISWPNTGSYTLQQNSNLALVSGWATSGYSISTINGTNSITITSPAGNLFFRLTSP
jgi:predicted Zn-dependent protease